VVFGLSMAMGPVLGGALVEAAGWRGVFWVNIPVGIAALVLTAVFVPESKAPRPRRLDPVGQLLVAELRAVADLRGHRGPGLRLGIGEDLVVLRGRGDRAGRLARL
jgi:MFS family permease